MKDWKWLTLLVCIAGLVSAAMAEARVASRFSLSTAEEYNDNVFFSTKKNHDFVTVITPGVHFLYQPQGQSDTLFTANLVAPAEIYARNTNLTNMGDRLSLNTVLRHQLTSQWTFTLTDCFGRVGRSRVGGLNGARGGNFPTSSGAFSSAGGPGQVGNLVGGGFGGLSGSGCGGLVGGEGFGRAQPGSVLSANEFIQSGDTITNRLQASLVYFYSPNLVFDGRYYWNRTEFLDAKGPRDSSGRVIDASGYEQDHSVDVGARYSFWRQHTLKARYRVIFLRTRDGRHETLHDVDVGDDFFTSRQINLTPTLSIWASTGLSMATGRQKFRLVHKLDVALVQIWRTALFTVGARRGLGASFGVGGPAYTTDFFIRYVHRLSQRMAGFASVQFSLYDTQGSADFETFQAVAGVQYWLTSWMSANLVYQYRRFDAENAARSTLLRSAAISEAIDGNSVTLSLTAYFDIWPNLGFARGSALTSPLFSPTGLPGVAGTPSTGPDPQTPESSPTGPANP